MFLARDAYAVVVGEEQSLPRRPTIACTADLVTPGTIEVELGYLFRRLPGGAAQHTLPILAKLTLARWVQLQVGGNGLTFQTITPKFYADDIVLGIKFHIRDQTRRGPSISWSVAASLPVMSANGYARSDDLLMTAYITKDVWRVHGDLNLGLNMWNMGGDTIPQPWAALALSGDLGKGFSLMGETYVFAPGGRYATRDGGFLFALAYSPRKWVVLDAGGDVGFFWAQRKASAFIGSTFAPFRYW